MIPGFEKIVEQRIKKARQEGAFDNLPGKGAPLRLQDDRHVPENLRLTYKILKNTDCLPPEIELRKTKMLMARCPRVNPLCQNQP